MPTKIYSLFIKSAQRKMLPKAEGMIQLQNANGLPKGKPSDGRKKKLWLLLVGVQNLSCTPFKALVKTQF
jgi:hypothetical protein